MIAKLQAMAEMIAAIKEARDAALEEAVQEVLGYTPSTSLLRCPYGVLEELAKDIRSLKSGAKEEKA